MNNKVLLAMTMEEAKKFNIYNEEDNQTFAEMEEDAEAYLREALEAQASKLLIEITARCKETTEALIEEVKKEACIDLLEETEQCYSMDMGDYIIVTHKSIEQLKAKYAIGEK